MSGVSLESETRNTELETRNLDSLGPLAGARDYGSDAKTNGQPPHVGCYGRSGGRSTRSRSRLREGKDGIGQPPHVGCYEAGGRIHSLTLVVTGTAEKAKLRAKLRSRSLSLYTTRNTPLQHPSRPTLTDSALTRRPYPRAVVAVGPETGSDTLHRPHPILAGCGWPKMNVAHMQLSLSGVSLDQGSAA